MAKYRTSRTLPTILTIIVIIIIIAGLVALARLIFTGSTSSDAVDRRQVIQDSLVNTNSNRSVMMTVRGKIVADEDFRSYTIQVSPTSRVIQSYNGYLGSVIDKQTLANNTAAYEQFVHALSKANFAASVPFEGERNDVRGICATGTVHEFSILEDNKVKTMLWTSSCSGSQGSLRASATQLSNLFLNQIPDGSEITKQLRL